MEWTGVSNQIIQQINHLHYIRQPNSRPSCIRRASFARQLGEQSQKDPLWKSAPSSLYFVSKAAIELGLVSQHKSVIENFVGIFESKNGEFLINTKNLLTNDDFRLIHEKMKTEDQLSRARPDFEEASSIEPQRFHENWLLGFGLGIPNAFEILGKQEVHDLIVRNVIERQSSEGNWHPKRVPWVTARVLIGAGQAGLTCQTDDWVLRGCRSLLSTKHSDGYWHAHTGGWNNRYETTALVLEAFALTRFDRVDGSNLVEQVANQLLEDRHKWMVLNPQVTEASAITMVDGITAACVLLKNGFAEDDLVDYLISTEERFTGEFFIKSGDLDLNNNQSCALAQVPSFLIEAGWSILGADIGELLAEYLDRANLRNRFAEAFSEGVFISYFKKDQFESQFATGLAEYLSSKSIRVWLDQQLEGGEDCSDFMKKISECSKLILIGSKNYVSQAGKNGTGIWNEMRYIQERMHEGDKEFVIPVVLNESIKDGTPVGLKLNNGLARLMHEGREFGWRM